MLAVRASGRLAGGGGPFLGLAESAPLLAIWCTAVTGIGGRIRVGLAKNAQCTLGLLLFLVDKAAVGSVFLLALLGERGGFVNYLL